MATNNDVRRIAMSFPEVTEGPDAHRYSVAGKHFTWLWRERIDPKKARVPNPDIIAVRVADDIDKQILIHGAPDKYFTEPHYDGYPAVLVRLAAIDLDELHELLLDAYRSRAPKRLLKDT